jgi:hypothetical protein
VLHDEPHLEGWTEAQPRPCAARRHGVCHKQLESGTPSRP